MTHLTFAEAIIVGLIQGTTELFPVSSLGHNVLIPALIGGNWASDLNVSKAESPYLAFVVGLHVATAIGITAYFWRDWIRIIGGFFSSIARMEVKTPDQKLAWMIVLATIPVGLVGLAFEHKFRVIFGSPQPGGHLPCAQRHHPLRRRAVQDPQVTRGRRAGAQGARGGARARRAPAGSPARTPRASGPSASRRSRRPCRPTAGSPRSATVQAILIGSAQILALLAGISRDGVTMVAGMFRGLSREDAARFAFLLATPVILAAGVLKIPDLLGPLGNGIRPQILAGSIVSGVAAYLSVRFLMKYFQTRTLTPFAIYCVVFGLASYIYLTVK